MELSVGATNVHLSVYMSVCLKAAEGAVSVHITEGVIIWLLFMVFKLGFF